jgi:DNA-binding NarL/FixJ family response regulator
MQTRILVTDDHEIVREGIRTLIGRSGREWIICREASNGEEAIEAVKSLKPDVVILDITMPKMSGLEAASQIAELGTGCRILMFTMHESERLSGEVRRAGAQGFVLKSQAARDLIRAIDQLLAGGTFFGADPQPGAQPEPSTEPGNETLLNSRSNLSFKCRSRNLRALRCAKHTSSYGD